MQDKITNVFIGDGTNLPADGTSASITTNISIVSDQMTNMNASGYTINTTPKIYFVNKMSDSTLKRSVPIVGVNLSAYTSKAYKPATKCVWSIGYNRDIAAASSPTGSAISAGGFIEVNQLTQYNFDIHFTNDKTFYSERPEYLRVSFTSSASATQLTIATQINNAINNSAWGGKEVSSIIVTDGSGNYGVEVWALDIPQFRETSYTVEYVNFSVQADSSTGFGATTVTQLCAMAPGSGTYESVYTTEKWAKKDDGVLNWTKFPIPTQQYLASSAGTTSGTVTTVTGTSGNDYATFAGGSITQLPTGSTIMIDGYTYIIKYWSTTTVAVLTSALQTSPSTSNVTAKAWYDTFTFKVTDLTKLDGPGVLQVSEKYVIVYLPAIDAGTDDMTALSTVINKYNNVMGEWLGSTPLNPSTTVS